MTQNPLHALIVEDSAEDALLVLRELRRGGYDVVSVRVDSAAGMQAALAERVWDVVISDYSMPHFSGLAALQVLKERGLDVPFIIVSGAIGEDTAIQAMRHGAHDYLMKDKLARLVPAVERELREAAAGASAGRPTKSCGRRSASPRSVRLPQASPTNSTTPWRPSS